MKPIKKLSKTNKETIKEYIAQYLGAIILHEGKQSLRFVISDSVLWDFYRNKILKG